MAWPGVPAGAVPAGPRLSRRPRDRGPAGRHRRHHHLHRRHPGGADRPTDQVLMTTAAATLSRRSGLSRRHLPVVHQLRQSVGLQRGMLVAGLVITAGCALVAILAPALAPYGYAQLSDASGSFGT